MNKTKIISVLLVNLLVFSSIYPAYTCCDPTNEPVEVPACFLVGKEPKIKENIDSAKSTVDDLKKDFTDAAKIADEIEGLINGAGGNADTVNDQIRQKVKDARKKYNDLREKLGAREGAESSLITKLREALGRYKVKEKGQLKPRLDETKQIVNSLARTANILRALLRRLKFKDSRTTFKSVDTISTQLLDLLKKSVENVDLSINSGVCLWEVIDDKVSPTSIEPASDAKKKRLPVGTEVRSPAKQREVKDNLNPTLVTADGRVAGPDNCKFHHVHGTVKSKSDPDETNCGHGSVDNTDIECPNCPALQVDMIKIPENTSESECVLFAEAEEGMTAVRNPRRNYEEWIKQLICTYLESDFTNPSNIESFTQTAFAAFRENATQTGVSSNTNIVHIVARNPATIDVNKEGKNVLVSIKSPTVKRSNRDSTKSAVGITRSVKDKIKLFNSSKPAKNEEEQNALIPIAENAITYLFLLKKAADIFATSTAAQLQGSEKTAAAQLAADTKTFNNQFLSESKVRILTPELNYRKG